MQLVLVFQTSSEMGKKRIRVRYTELMTLLSIFKVTVHMNFKILEKSKMRVMLLNF